MASTLVTIAEAVKDVLQAGTYSFPFTPVRLYVLPRRIEDLALELTVAVVPRQMTAVNQSRAQELAKTEIIDIGIWKKLDGATANDVDPYMDFAEEIMDDLATKRATIATGFMLMLVQQNPIWDPEALEQARCLFTRLELTFRVL